jgi:cytochrome c biogenesis protein CcmG, thiol:disulfide interchange protein DsbE
MRRPSGIVALPLVIFLAMAGMFAYALRTGDPTKLPSTLIGKAAPALELAALDGVTVPGFGTKGLAAGEVTVVNFWASWCAPCVAEHPLLSELKVQGKVRLFGVNYKDPPPGGRRFLGRYGNPFDAVGVDPTGRGAIEWGVYGMPETFVIDGAGRIAYKHVGPLTEAAISLKLLPAIKAARSK